MSDFANVLFYIIFCSLGVMISGIHWPRNIFDYSGKLFSPKKWELNSKFYSIIKVGKWKDKVPDISKYFKKIPTKKLGSLNTDSLKSLISETCVAEAAHYLLILLAIPVNFILDGASGFWCFFVYSIGNLPYIIIQRYNRPRLVKLLERMENK